MACSIINSLKRWQWLPGKAVSTRLPGIVHHPICGFSACEIAGRTYGAAFDSTLHTAPGDISRQKLLKHYLQVKRLEDDLIGEMDESGNKGYTSIAVGINADSLAFWLLEAIHPFLLEERVLLDIRVNDQEQTHRLLKDGEVMGASAPRSNPCKDADSNISGA